MRFSNLGWGGVVAGVLVLVVAVIQFKQDKPESITETEFGESAVASSKQIQPSLGKIRPIQLAQRERGATQHWKRSDEVLRHRAVAKADLEQKTKYDSSILKKIGDPTTVSRKPAPPIYPGAFHASIPVPPGREDLGQWVARPISKSEVIEKRKRLARGERLFKRLIIRHEDGPSNLVPGGMRESSIN